jgi:hypothetical protein
MVGIDQSATHLTLCSSPSEANVLRELQLQNQCALGLTLCRGAGLRPKVRMKKRPVIQGVPLHGNGHYPMPTECDSAAKQPSELALLQRQPRIN